MIKLYIYAILISILSITPIFSDTNGIWTYPGDIKPGVFGEDESSDYIGENYTFNHSVYFNKDILTSQIIDLDNPVYFLDPDQRSDLNRIFIPNGGVFGIVNPNLFTSYQLYVKGQAGINGSLELNGVDINNVFVNEGQSNSISSNMIQSNSVDNSKIDVGTPVSSSDITTKSYLENYVDNSVSSIDSFSEPPVCDGMNALQWDGDSWVCQSFTPACSDECSYSGQTSCSGSDVVTCGNYDADTCLEYGSPSSCSNGCSGGSCITCSSQSSSQCYAGDVYWYDSCGNRENVRDYCGSNEACSGGSCYSTCSSQSSSACYGGDVWWYDSCGDRGSMKESCGSNEECNNGACENTCVSNEGEFCWLDTDVFLTSDCMSYDASNAAIAFNIESKYSWFDTREGDQFKSIDNYATCGSGKTIYKADVRYWGYIDCDGNCDDSITK